MKPQFSLTGLSIAVLMFAGTVAMHQAARAEDVFTGPVAPIAKKLKQVDVYTGPVAPVIEKLKQVDVYTGSLAPMVNSLAPLADELLSEELEEEFEGKHHGKHGKNGKHGKHGKNGKNHGKHGKKGKHHDENEGLSTLEGPEDMTIVD
jgi:hypothetical protein